MSAPALPPFDISAAKLNPDTVAIVTGSADGLGKAFAHALLQKGAKGVCISDVNEEKGKGALNEFAKEFGEDRVTFVKCDVTAHADFEAVFAKTKERFGPVNLMVNNAGILNENVPDLCIDVNVKGTIAGTFSAIKYMGSEAGGKGGKIINVASLAGLGPAVFMPVYAASKHAIVGLTKSLAVDPRLQAQGITFGILCPAFAKTAIIENPALFRRPAEDFAIAESVMAKQGVLEIAEVRDAFLRLVLDDSFKGKAMTLTKAGGLGMA
ncbi:15-hydroxyprostaglandin dehydrogenase [NAD(+)]-like [Patiria miniata]|uniref:15-hydroxyprostaglandin dehydrogenase [NAD(+)] n=1 Tax=Patiria miniata TaxID=46514 RepID=A0A913ZNI0_PATMI|nr:15-hydroxyprostaglandin dehydrogenase [NAD(+)]-like [Patiria miniata]XP_038053292.1 15-hydroxyprostaglandin dehydrogenase [NAD(+)]-like [Patiria miniata]XP_038053293.1 15-hydroxyprostaglandin dehydrogenase [NAD(+)]-like [Patiria miniata]